MLVQWSRSRTDPHLRIGAFLISTGSQPDGAPLVDQSSTTLREITIDDDSGEEVSVVAVPFVGWFLRIPCTRRGVAVAAEARTWIGRTVVDVQVARMRRNVRRYDRPMREYAGACEAAVDVAGGKCGDCGGNLIGDGAGGLVCLGCVAACPDEVEAPE